MPDYHLSKIYKIEPINSLDEGDVYYGSSVQKYLSTRMTQHVSKYKCQSCNMSSHILFEKYGVSNCNIVLVENYPCNSKDELFAREKYYIKNFKCVNQLTPLHNDKEYRKENKDRIKQNKKEYYNKNQEQIKQHNKEFYENNKQKILQSQKEYTLKNKEKIAAVKKVYLEKNSEKIECECGITCKKINMKRHLKTEKHAKIMESKTN